MEITFKHSDPRAEPWQKDEVVTVKITNVAQDGTYTADTIETWPVDLRQQHADAIAAQGQEHADYIEKLNTAHAEQVAAAHALIKAEQDRADGLLESHQVEIAGLKAQLEAAVAGPPVVTEPTKLEPSLAAQHQTAFEANLAKTKPRES